MDIMLSDELKGRIEGLLYDVYGTNNQKLKLCEECAELIQALIKGNIEHIMEEMADVQILLNQMMHYVDEGVVDMFREKKLVRQIARLNASIESGSISIPDSLKDSLKHIIFEVSEQISRGSDIDNDDIREKTAEKCDPTDWD